jgi:hypothetical protein
MFLIAAMTLYQLIYDITFYPNMMCNPGTDCYNITFVCQIIGGLTQAIISNEIAVLAFITIYFRTVYDVLKHKVLFMSIANAPSIALCLSFFVYLANGDAMAGNVFFYGYYYLRFASIAVITITIGATVFFAWKLTRLSAQHHLLPAQAIWVLVQRLVRLL